MKPFKLSDSRFDPSAARMSAYFSRLFIQAGKGFLRYALLDTDRHCFIGAADYRTTNDFTPAKWREEFELLIASDDYLQGKYPAVATGLESPYHTFVPSSFLDKDKMTTQLALNFDLPQDLCYHADFIPEIDAWNVAGFENCLIDPIKEHFPQGIIVHATTPLLKRFAIENKQLPGPSRLLIHFSGKQFHLAAFSDQSFVFFNTFRHESYEDILYYTLYTAEQLRFRGEETTVRLSSDEVIDPEVIKLLREFLPNLGLITRPDGILYSPMLDFQDYQYVSLFSLALCGS